LQVDWVSQGKKKPDTGEIMNETAVETLRSIENRLNGLVESSRKLKSGARPTINIPLSPPGQVSSEQSFLRPLLTNVRNKLVCFSWQVFSA
jgi:hypothetical protein